MKKIIRLWQCFTQVAEKWLLRRIIREVRQALP
jgi:hypothetical protein